MAYNDFSDGIIAYYNISNGTIACFDLAKPCNAIRVML